MRAARMNELPVVRGLMVCERVIVDSQTGRRTFVNRFTSHPVERFPSPPVSFAALVVLANGFGDIPISLVIGHLESDGVIFHYQTVEHFTDRLRTHLLVIRVNGLVFPTVGEYELTLYADDEPLTRSILKLSVG
jgi:hypothetical protein